MSSAHAVQLGLTASADTTLHMHTICRLSSFLSEHDAAWKPDALRKSDTLSDDSPHADLTSLLFELDIRASKQVVPTSSLHTASQHFSSRSL